MCVCLFACIYLALLLIFFLSLDNFIASVAKMNWYGKTSTHTNPQTHQSVKCPQLGSTIWVCAISKTCQIEHRSMSQHQTQSERVCRRKNEWKQEEKKTLAANVFSIQNIFTYFLVYRSPFLSLCVREFISLCVFFFCFLLQIPISLVWNLKLAQHRAFGLSIVAIKVIGIR